MVRRQPSPRSLAIAAFVAVWALIVACGGTATPNKIGELESTSSPAITGEAAQTATPAVESTSNQQQGAATEPTADAATEPTAEPATHQSFAVGDIISIKDLTLVVLGWSEPEPTDFAKPDPGNRFVAIDLLAVNSGQSATSVSSLVQMSLKDSTSQVYKVDLLANTASGKSALDGEIAPGERLRGTVAFQTLADATGLTFVFDADVFGAGKVFVALGDAPVAVEPPAELAGERKQQAFAVGDVIEIGDLSLTVGEVSSPQGNDFAKPEDGSRFVVIDLTIENRGKTAAALSSLMQMALKDASGQTYRVDLMATAAANGTTPDGELAPGEKIRGQVGFQAPAAAQGLIFVFDADVFGAGKVFVALPDA